MTTPKGVRNLADRYKDLFKHEYSDLCAFILYFLWGSSSMSDLVRNAPWTRSVSSLSRSAQNFPNNRFMRRLRSSVLRKYNGQIDPDSFVYVIDDTANPKYSGNVFNAGAWHGSSGPWFGQKVMVLALVDKKRGISIPIGYIIAAKEGELDHKTGPDMAIQLLKQAISEDWPSLPVVFDSWFDSQDLMEKVQELGLTYCGELKGNRKAKNSTSEIPTWTSLPETFKGCSRSRLYTCFDSEKIKKRLKRSKVGANLNIYIKNRKTPLNAIAVYNRRNGKKAFGYYVTTDLSMSGAKIWEISRARWKIEVMFRDLKQNLSFGRLPTAGESNAHLAVCIPFLILTSLRLSSEKHWDFENETMTIGEQVDQIRESALVKSIDYLVVRQNIDVIKTLKSRRAMNRLNKKPVNRLAEAA